jgi:hypothetical protein
MDNAHDGKPESGKPVASQLPMVWSPSLAAGQGAGDSAASGTSSAQSFSFSSSSADESTMDEASKFAESSSEESSSGASSPSRQSRFMLLAASVAIAAAVGSMAGSLSGLGLAQLMSSPAASPTMNEASSPQTVQAIKAELVELSALKASLDSATKNTNGQFAKLADRLDRVERAEAEPSTKLAHIADAVDRLEKRSTVAAVAPMPNPAPETTGSIASNEPPVPAPSDMKPLDRILPNWVVQDVRGNRALVASRYGGMFAVAAGGFLPGLGRVESIKRQEGHWIVVTERGVITSDR